MKPRCNYGCRVNRADDHVKPIQTNAIENKGRLRQPFVRNSMDNVNSRVLLSITIQLIDLG